MPNTDRTPIPDHVFQDAANAIVAAEQLTRPYADRVPAPRPVPTTRQRLTDARRCHTPEQHRHDDGDQADAASHDRAMREMQAELAAARAKLRIAERDRDDARDDAKAIAVARNQLRADLDSTEQVAQFREGVINLHTAELGAAGEVIAVVRDAQEQIERALARYDTTPEVSPVEADSADLDEALEHAESAFIDRDDSVWRPVGGGRWTTRYLEPMTRDEIEQAFGPTRAVLLVDIEPDDKPDTEAEASLGSVSPHAQDDHAHGYAEAIAYLRDDERYMHWWSSTGVKPAGTVRQHLADYLETVGPDKPQDDPEGAEQVLRDRLEHAIRNRLAVAWKTLPIDEVWLPQVAAVAAVAAVNELRQG